MREGHRPEFEAALDGLLRRQLPGQCFSLKEISKATGMSKQGISRIEQTALSKLRRSRKLRDLMREYGWKISC